MKRTPRYYDGIKPTNKQLVHLLPEWLSEMQKKLQDKPDLVLLSWKELVGEKIAPMTEALSFVDGVLTIKVKNSTVYSLLVQYESARLQKELQKRFPSVIIKRIVFRLG